MGNQSHKMTTFVITLVTLVILLLSACNSLRLENTSRNPGNSWQTEGGDNFRSHALAIAPQPPLVMDWEYNAAAAFGPGGPLVLGEYVLVATRKGEIHAIEIERGKKSGVKGFGDAINGSPALDGSTLYIPVAWGRKTGVVAYELRSGSRLWWYESAPVTRGILIAGSTIVFSDDRSIVHALAPDGIVRWSRQLDARFAVTSTPVQPAEGIAVIANDTGLVSGLDIHDGTTVWERDLREAVYSSLSSLPGVVFVPTTRGSLYALDAFSGRTVWHFRTGEARVKLSTPAASERAVVVGASDGTLTSLRPAGGEVQWTWTAAGAITAAPVIGADIVFVGVMDATAHALSLETGEVIWSTELEGRVKSAPTLAGNGLYLLSEPRHVYRFTPVADELAEKE